MDSEKEFQEKMRKLGTLVGELDQMPGGGSKVATRELVQLLMEVHRTGLERIMELVFDSGKEQAGAAAINRLGQDPIVRNLLLLYSLHPDDLETRVLQALEAVKGRLRKVDQRSKAGEYSRWSRSTPGAHFPSCPRFQGQGQRPAVDRRRQRL